MVMVLHLHGLLLMYHAIWLSPIAGSVTPEMVWLSWPAITTSLASRPEPSKSRVGVARIKPSRKPPPPSPIALRASCRDPHTGIITLSTKRCTVALLLIVAGFGCNLGQLDTDPGQGDLFDPKYKVAPLTLPQSLADSPGVLP